MKRLTLLIAAAMLIFAAKAQLPNNWTGDTDIETFQETTTVHGGNSSCGVIVNSGTQSNCDLTNEVAISVAEGDDFKVSFWGITSEHVRITCVLDWEGASSLYTNTYLDPGTSDWGQWVFEGTVPDGVTAVNLRLRFYDVSGFVAPQTQFVDDLEFESPIGEPIVVDNGDFENWPSILPEPSNYPENFSATPVSLNMNLAWTDATGETLPDAYLILASTDDNIDPPADGVYVPDDLDITDGSGAVNVSFGDEFYSFTNLEAQTTYYFVIYPYTNSGANIDFKNDGTAPTAMGQTSNVVILNEEDFDTGWGEWTTISLEGDQVWSRDNSYGIGETPCAQISGYEGGSDYANEDWLISPPFDFDDYENEVFSFFTALGYPIENPQFTVKVSTDYDGGGDPTTATWNDLDPILPTGEPYWEWTYSGELDVSGFEGTAVYMAFVYLSDGTDSETWEVDNIMVTGEGVFNPDPEPTNYPTDFAAMAEIFDADLTWTDATGEVLPAGYLVLGSDQVNINLPEDGVEIPDDTDFSDGTAALNVGPGIGTCSFGGLMENTTYYFQIFPYTNSGMYIDYKTDGTPPQAEATTGESNLEEIFYTTFDESWEGWEVVSLVGDQFWSRDNSYGIEGTPCAQMSGYEGGDFANEDWLISPPVNFSNWDNEVFSFHAALGYPVANPQISVKISTDYDGGGDPSSASWTDLDPGLPSGEPFWEWTYSGDLDVSGFDGEAVYLAFVYLSDGTESETWEIDNVMLMGEDVSSIGDYSELFDMQLFPNPAKGLLQFNSEMKVDQVKVFSASGALVHDEILSRDQYQLDLRHLDGGMYLVRFINKIEGIYTTERLIIQ